MKLLNLALPFWALVAAVVTATAQEPPRPLPPPPKMIHIEATVIEVVGALDVDLSIAGTEIDSLPRGGKLRVLPKPVQEEVVRALAESKVAKVISRPKIITLDGQAAHVQVGQEVAIGGDSDDSVEVGLQLQCLPTIVDEKKLRVDVKCKYTELLSGESDVQVQQLASAVELEGGETVVLSSGGKGKLFVFLSPQVIDQEPRLAKRAKPKSGVQAAPRPKVLPNPVASDHAWPMTRHVTRVQEIFRKIDPESLSSINVKADSIAVVAYLPVEKASQVPSILDDMIAGDLEILSVQTDVRGKGTSIEIECKLIQPPKGVDAALGEFDQVMQKLFPDQNVEIVPLPNSVVLRGNVSEKVMQQVIAVAEQYVPTVINQMDTTTDTMVAPKKSTRDRSDQIESLHRDVRALRKEVQAVLKLLKANSAGDSFGLNQQSDAAGDDASVEKWKLTWPVAVTILGKNFGDEEKEQLNRRTESAKQAFEMLRFRQAEHAAQEARLAPLRQFEAAYRLQGMGSPYVSTSQQQSHEQRLKAMEQQIEQHEHRLRELLGVPKSDGRQITPIE